MRQEEIAKAFENIAKMFNDRNENPKIGTPKYNITLLKWYASAYGGLPEHISKDIVGQTIQDSDGREIVVKSIEDLIRAYKPNNQLVNRKVDEVLDAIYHNTDIINLLPKKTSNNRVYTSDIRNFKNRFLLSTARLGRQLNADEQDNLYFTTGKDIMTRNVEAQWNIPFGLIADNLDNPSFLREQEAMFFDAIGGDVAKLRVEGTGIAGTSFDSLIYGHNYLLKNINGANQFSSETAPVYGNAGKFLTPNKVNIVNANMTGEELLSTMEKLIDSLPERYRNDKDVVFMMSRKMADLYARTRAQASMGALYTSGSAPTGTSAVGVNTNYRDMLKTTGEVPTYEGYRVLVEVNEKPLSDGGIIFFGGLEELEVINQLMFDWHTELNRRSSIGGGAAEMTAHFFMAFNIRIPERCSLAFVGAKVEKPHLINAGSGKGSIIGSSTIAQGETLTVYPFTDTKDAEIFYSNDADKVADYATAVSAVGSEEASKCVEGEAEELEEGSSPITYHFRAFKDGVLLPSDIQAITVTRAT